MNIGNFRVSKLQIIILTVLLVGMAAGVILVQRQQTLKSKAEQDIGDNFEITDDQGNELNCQGSECETKSLDVQIRIKDINGF